MGLGQNLEPQNLSSLISPQVPPSCWDTKLFQEDKRKELVFPETWIQEKQANRRLKWLQINSLFQTFHLLGVTKIPVFLPVWNAILLLSSGTFVSSGEKAFRWPESLSLLVGSASSSHVDLISFNAAMSGSDVAVGSPKGERTVDHLISWVRKDIWPFSGPLSKPNETSKIYVYFSSLEKQGLMTACMST